MTDSIKPPGFGAPPLTAPARSEPSAVVQPATSTSTPSPTAAVGQAQLVEALRNGQMTPGQVVNALVEGALQQASAQGLPLPERAGLETLLRSMLASDPTLGRLIRELER